MGYNGHQCPNIPLLNQAWMSNYIPLKSMGVIINACPDNASTVVVSGALKGHMVTMCIMNYGISK